MGVRRNGDSAGLCPLAQQLVRKAKLLHLRPCLIGPKHGLEPGVVKLEERQGPSLEAREGSLEVRGRELDSRRGRGLMGEKGLSWEGTILGVGMFFEPEPRSEETRRE